MYVEKVQIDRRAQRGEKFFTIRYINLPFLGTRLNLIEVQSYISFRYRAVPLLGTKLYLLWVHSCTSFRYRTVPPFKVLR